MTGPLPLGAVELGLAAGLVLLLAAATWALRLGIAGSLLISALRMAVQLLLVGLVLDWVFGLDHPAAVGGLLLLMILIAGREVVARQRGGLRGGSAYAIGSLSMGLSSGIVGCVLLLAIIRPTPFWEPHYAIPLIGMLLGNTMNGIAIALERFTAELHDRRLTIEARLCAGHSLAAALTPIRRRAMQAGLIPTINGMAIAGLVSLPGMMTGQILSGTPPAEAVRYQILIWLAIAAGTGFGTMLAIELCRRRLGDERDRLRLDRLQPKR